MRRLVLGRVIGQAGEVGFEEGGESLFLSGGVGMGGYEGGDVLRGGAVGVEEEGGVGG
jgi:hypothetical protein